MDGMDAANVPAGPDDSHNPPAEQTPLITTQVPPPDPLTHLDPT